MKLDNHCEEFPEFHFCYDFYVETELSSKHAISIKSKWHCRTHLSSYTIWADSWRRFYNPNLASRENSKKFLSQLRFRQNVSYEPSVSNALYSLTLWWHYDYAKLPFVVAVIMQDSGLCFLTCWWNHFVLKAGLKRMEYCEVQFYSTKSVNWDLQLLLTETDLKFVLDSRIKRKRISVVQSVVWFDFWLTKSLFGRSVSSNRWKVTICNIFRRTRLIDSVRKPLRYPFKEYVNTSNTFLVMLLLHFCTSEGSPIA